jgi:3-oxoacyl-[acyl-carrier protein] reductase
MSTAELADKNAVIYGGGGSLGGAIAKAMAQEGARVFLAARNLAPAKKVADEIIAAGGYAEALTADATDAEAVGDFLEKVTRKAGTLDLSYCAINYQVVQNVPLVEMQLEDYIRPVTIAARSFFITATAAGKVMMKQRSGVILSLTATPGGIGYPFTAGFAPACAVIECSFRNLASELGAYGVRVVNMRSGGSPDSQVFKQARERHPEEMDKVLRRMEDDTMLKKLPTMQEVANTAVFLASDRARSITGVTVDITGGTTAALNHRMPRAGFAEGTSVGPRESPKR